MPPDNDNHRFSSIVLTTTVKVYLTLVIVSLRAYYICLYY